MIGVSQKQLSRIENGEVSVTIEILRKVAIELAIELDLILSFNSKYIFNNNSVSQTGGEFKAFNLTAIDDVVNLYERLLKEKDEIIQILKEKLSK